MKPSIQKLRKFFRLEAERGYDNKAVMGGLTNILSAWELEAREDQLPEQIIQAIISRLRDYHRLSEESREVALKGIWQRITRENLAGETAEASKRVSEQPPTPEPAETIDPTPEPEPALEPVPEPDNQVQPREAPAEPPPQQPIIELDYGKPITSIKGFTLFTAVSNTS